MLDIKDTLVIIGNGFDLAHGYKTRFKDFADYGYGKGIKEIFDLFNREKRIDVDNWYDFEELIREATITIHGSIYPDPLFEKYKGKKWKAAAFSSWSADLEDLRNSQ